MERSLSRKMKTEKIEVTFIRRAKKTMEDVFVHLVEKQRTANVENQNSVQVNDLTKSFGGFTAVDQVKLFHPKR